MLVLILSCNRDNTKHIYIYSHKKSFSVSHKVNILRQQSRNDTHWFETNSLIAVHMETFNYSLALALAVVYN